MILKGWKVLPPPQGTGVNVWRQFWLSQLGRGLLLTAPGGWKPEMLDIRPHPDSFPKPHQRISQPQRSALPRPSSLPCAPRSQKAQGPGLHAGQLPQSPFVNPPPGCLQSPLRWTLKARCRRLLSLRTPAVTQTVSQVVGKQNFMLSKCWARRCHPPHQIHYKFKVQLLFLQHCLAMACKL